jgi:hypothetical protein
MGLGQRLLVLLHLLRGAIDVTFNEYGVSGGGHEPSLGVLGQLHFSM